MSAGARICMRNEKATHGHPRVDPGELASVFEESQEADGERKPDDRPHGQTLQQVEDEGAVATCG